MTTQAERAASGGAGRLTGPQRRLLGQRLEEARGRDRHLAARLGEAYGVSASWLRTQRRRVERGEQPRPVGRPRLSSGERERVRALVRAQLERQGKVGWRRVMAGIRREQPPGERLSTMLVQQETAAIHREGRVQRRRACERRRVGLEVLCRDAIWAQDATHVGRLETGREISAEVATDRATLSTVILAVGAPAAGEDLVGHLERAKVERGGLPLVWQSDGGGANRSAAVASYLERERVVHLLSRPHTPTDNPSAERKNRELKEEGALDAAASRTAEAADAALACARRRVDEGRLRASRGWKTAAELDRERPRADAFVDRDRFYAEARSAIRAAALGHDDARSRRKAEQDALWATLERHGLARRHVGLRPTPQPRATPVAHTAAGVE